MCCACVLFALLAAGMWCTRVGSSSTPAEIMRRAGRCCMQALQSASTAICWVGLGLLGGATNANMSAAGCVLLEAALKH